MSEVKTGDNQSVQTEKKSSVLKSTLVFLAIIAGICLVGYLLF